MKRCLRLLLQMAAIILLIDPGVAHAESIPPDVPPVLISEVQTGGKTNGIENGQLEFIELHNPGDNSVSIAGWRLEYLSATHNGGTVPTRLLATLSGEIARGQFIVIANGSYLPAAELHFDAGNIPSGALAKSGGQLRLVQDSKTIDRVMWGSASVQSPWWRSVEVPVAFSIQRILPGDVRYTDGFAFFEPTDLMTPGAPPESILPSPDACIAIVLSEILPNPEGADAGYEFIEIYNPTNEPINLKGCSLRLGEKGRPYALPEELLEAKSYRAFYDSETGIVLPNATGQIVTLFTTNFEESVTYTDNLPDNVSWISFAGQWQKTIRLTPGGANIVELADANPEDIVGPVISPVPCAPGKERNPETNRCRNSTSEISDSSCEVGYVRNSETNRCRRATGAVAALTPCKTGQERNLDTGRCRSVLRAATVPRPCAPGHERNPSTNRCRKVIPAIRAVAVTDVPASPRETATYWWMGIAIVGCLGYALYEWRHDLTNALHRRKINRATKSQEL